MRFSTLTAWLDWQETLHPQSIDLGLDRVAQVWQRMGADLGDTAIVIVAGTNGKGSCVAMLESIYLAAGYHTGAYTSPHIFHYNERIRLDGRNVSDDVLCLAFDYVDQARADISLSYFEFGTLAALLLFSGVSVTKKNITPCLDIVILEVGLGGRLDAVNIIDADVALITSIDIDHCAWLGNDRDSIGFEKAGIFRKNITAVCGDPQPPASLQKQAGRLGTRLLILGQDFHVSDVVIKTGRWRWSGVVDCDATSVQQLRHCEYARPNLEGFIQLNNAASVLQVVTLLDQALPVKDACRDKGLRQVALTGRYQRLYCRPPLQRCTAGDTGSIEVIVDVAHNPAAAKVLAQMLADDNWQNKALIQGPLGKTRVVFAVLADKDISAIIAALLPVADVWYVTQVAAARSCKREELLTMVHTVQGDDALCAVMSYATVPQAVQSALRDADAGDRILVLGSFYTVAEFLAAVER